MSASVTLVTLPQLLRGDENTLLLLRIITYSVHTSIIIAGLTTGSAGYLASTHSFILAPSSNRLSNVIVVAR